MARPAGELMTEIFDALPDVGLRLNNLFQLESGVWQANVTDGVKLYEFGRGDTPVQALVGALGAAGVAVEL